jgi:hypothetical protein
MIHVFRQMTGSWCDDRAVEIKDDSSYSICMHFVEAEVGQIAVY